MQSCSPAGSLVLAWQKDQQYYCEDIQMSMVLISQIWGSKNEAIISMLLLQNLRPGIYVG